VHERAKSQRRGEKILEADAGEMGEPQGEVLIPRAERQNQPLSQIFHIQAGAQHPLEKFGSRPSLSYRAPSPSSTDASRLGAEKEEIKAVANGDPYVNGHAKYSGS
jgi:hypothetical protein